MPDSDTGEKSIDKTRCFRSGENPTYFVSLSYQNEMRYAYMVTTIRIPNELHQRIKMAAERQGMTLNGYLLSILWQYVEKES